jgi:hypothetical protein
MEATFTIQRSDQKRVDEVKRIRSALASGVSVLTNAERNTILSCAQAVEVNGVIQEQGLSPWLGRRAGKTPSSS